MTGLLAHALRPSRLALAVLAAVAIAPCAARAQAIVVSVNGDPVTSTDIEQRMKLLRAMRKPATRDAAIESMIQTRLKAREAGRFGIAIKDEEAPEELQTLGKKMKISAQQLATDIGRAGVTQTHASGYLKAELGYSVLIRALNRGVEASEIQVRQELVKEKSGAKTGGVVNYTIRQVVFTVDPGVTQAALAARAKEAEALRTRFTSCDSGIPYAKSLPGVAVREKLVRSSAQLNEAIKETLDKLPVGHLTGPSRSPNGIELIALCDRSTSRNDDDLRKEISERLLGAHYDQEADIKYKDMRNHAVIERR